MRFDWTDLQLFVHACDAGSLTGAAQRAHLTLAAVSARIRAMEANSATELLVRHSRGVRPTAAGDALARHARAVLEQMTQLHAELARHGSADDAPVRLLANTSAIARLVAGPLAQFLRGPHACEVNVEESASDLTTQALKQGVADIGLVSDAADVEGLDARAMGADPLVLLVPAGHALATLRQPTFSRALDFPWIGSGAASALHTHLALQAARLGKPLRLRTHVANIDAVQTLVAQGAGVTVLPQALIRPGLDAQAWVARPLNESWARRELLLCVSAAAGQRPAVRALLDCFSRP